MKILFTGASSFTGFWFVRELAIAGHDVVATFRRRLEEYVDDLRRARVSTALHYCRGIFDCSFGDARFVELARDERWDLLCHHAADATNYRSPEFNVASALRNNTHNLGAVLDALVAGGSRLRVLLTGSVFENDEGAGSEGLPAFSPYGLSKSFTFQVFRHEALRRGFSLGKFVIPNPFGPYEEPRFTSYLVRTWLTGQTAVVQTPAYVRDNIHVSLLANGYARFAQDVPDRIGLVKLNPSGYRESQGTFALRFASEMRRRSDARCKVELAEQADFCEPRVRINTDLLAATCSEWSEPAAWDEIARYSGFLAPTDTGRLE